MKTSIKDVKLIEVPKIHDVRGNLSVIENNTIPYEIKRVHTRAATWLVKRF